jgi:starch synthase
MVNAAIRILSVASELYPLVKTGGLADVAGALPRALAGQGIEMRSLLPGYRVVMAALPAGRNVHEFADLFGGPARLLHVEHPQAGGLYVLDAPHLYDRAGGPYQSPDGADWPDNHRRFAALSWAAREIGLGCLPEWRPDVVHGHDWQAGLAPAYLALAQAERPATVLTVHNLAFQGRFSHALLSELRLPPAAWGTEGVEYYGDIGFLKAGLYYADQLTTVSPTYAREIQTDSSGMGLGGLLRARADRLHGIVNGIDTAEWDPATDRYLASTYSARRLGARGANKRQVQQRFGLAEDGSPLLGVVSRLAWQKGIDLLLELLPWLVGQGAQLAVLGSGDRELEAALVAAVHRYPGRVGCVLGYDEAVSHQIQGGADAILVPSRFEPCGLTQLYGLRYGAVPIVARVGGLADTVIDANEAAVADGVATGFHFAPVAADTFRDALTRALTLYRKPQIWQALQRRGMTRELGWQARAESYAGIYRDLVRPNAEASMSRRKRGA